MSIMMTNLAGAPELIPCHFRISYCHLQPPYCLSSWMTQRLTKLVTKYSYLELTVYSNGWELLERSTNGQLIIKTCVQMSIGRKAVFLVVFSIQSSGNEGGNKREKGVSPCISQ
ncbi:hypothetical protein B9Z55_024890 [Caenorhabditis nigoni]|uniref:Uncharacterized protein n=1 Tax=Caenorhabditis nigoni TaxID=1611254 RepID=A0A2G5SW54_9PELO|nr:hypothetical protein B9Z55_024890 [Caenorhabditis nigoni]